jgi:rhodanese-related sulfurtransferase
MRYREFKDSLYAQFARLGHALSTPKRLELLDLLTQSEKTVEQLADGSATSLKNTSAHLRRLAAGEVTLIDVRPADEFAAGHIPGALSIPVTDLPTRAGELSRRKEIVAYCRGPYCVMASTAVELLRRRGYRARRFVESVPAWRARGYPVAREQRVS